MDTPETSLFPREGDSGRSGLDGAPPDAAARVKLWLWVGWFIAVIGALTLLVQVGDVISELYARATWTRVTGFVDSATLRDAAQRDSPGNASGSHTFFWAEFEVTFSPARDCGARRSAVNSATGVISCEGKIISHPEITSSDAQGWLNRHGIGRPAELLYDPNGKGVKFADESLVNSVEWMKVFMGLLFVGIGCGLALIARRQLRELANEEKSASAI